MPTGYYQPVSYAPPKPAVSAAFTLPTMPTIPAVSRPMIPGTQTQIANPATAPAWGNLTAQLAGLPGIYGPQMSLAKQNVQSALAGFGGLHWGVDNPATPEDESLNFSYDPNHALGARERQVVHQTIANIPSGLLGSSVANRAIGAAMQQLSDQEQQILGNFRAQIGQLAQQQFQAGWDITTQMGNLYGTDITWYTDPDQPWNQAPPAPPTPPEIAPAPTGPLAGGGPAGPAAQEGLYYGTMPGTSRGVFF